MNTPIMVFLSGRVVTLVLLICFQILVVRLLPPAEFATYALVFALATLMQTVVSFGIPRVISRYIGQAGWGIEKPVLRSLFMQLLGVRIAGTATILIIAFLCAHALGLTGRLSPLLMVSGGFFILAGVVQIDTDNAAQSLALQKMSRSCAVGESAARLALVATLAAAGRIDGASAILTVSLLTMALTTARLIYGVLHALSGNSTEGATKALDRLEVRQTALGGYASTLAWFASSPAVVRLIGGATLSLLSFAGFAFVQGLVVSLQRYTPGAMLFPFIEPTVMRDYGRTGDKASMENALSLISKIDMILIGAAIVGTLVAARPLVEVMTGGKYGAMAYAIPWLLLYVATIPVYKSFEIVAVLVGATSTLAATFAISVVWGILTYSLALNYGLPALLIGPLADALMRISYLFIMLKRHGVHRAADAPILGLMMCCLGFSGLSGIAATALLGLTGFATVAVGAVMAMLYLASIVLIRPFRSGEVASLTSGIGDGGLARFARRLAQRLARP